MASPQLSHLEKILRTSNCGPVSHPIVIRPRDTPSFRPTKKICTCMYKVMCFTLLLLFCLFFVLCLAVIMLGNRKTTRYTATFLGIQRFPQQTCLRRHLLFYNGLGHQVRSPSLVGQIYYKINSHKSHQSDWPALSLFSRGQGLVRLSLSFTRILFHRLYRMIGYYPRFSLTQQLL